VEKLLMWVISFVPLSWIYITAKNETFRRDNANKAGDVIVGLASFGQATYEKL
jgi:hypothetical protein